MVKVVTTAGPTCNASNPTAATLAAGLRAWGTKPHFPGFACTQKGQINGSCVCIAAPGSTNLVQLCLTETAFALPGINSAQLSRLTSFCGFIQANGSGFGICRSCRLGGQGAVSQ
jgi:hypothetical protein